MSNILYVKKGSKLKTSNNNIIVSLEDDMNKVCISELSLILIENLECSLTANVSVLATNNGVPIIYCDNKHSPVALTSSFNNYHKQLLRVKEQIDWSTNRKNKYFIEIIKIKIINQLELLKYLNIEEYIINNINGLLININKDNVEFVEAQVAKIYFTALFGKDFIRHNNDEINSSLNYGYAMLRGVIKQIVSAKGLMPTLGIWHKSQYNNFNLADDLIEVYRPMVDYITFHFLVRDDEFTKEERVTLQHVIFQNVLINDKIYDFETSVDMVVNNLIGYMNKSHSEINLPRLDCDLYEY